MSKYSAQSQTGQTKSTAIGYRNGLLYCVILTLIPFFLVITGICSRQFIVAVIIFCATAQILLQLIFFLHMNTSSKQMYNTVSAVFVVVIVAIVLLGTLWIMQHLNHNMLMGH